MTEREDQLKKDRMTASHFMDLSRRAYEGSYITFSGFLDMHEASIALKQKASYPAPCMLWGGIDDAERKMAAFVPPELSGTSPEYPLEYLKLSPAFKGESEDFGHRDILGSMMGLGIRRSLVGDIIREGDTGSWYIICSDVISGMLCEELVSVKRTRVKTEPANITGADIKRSFKEKRCTVPSLRLDAVISSVFNMSRQLADIHIKAGKVFLNSEEEEQKSASVKDGDIISVRGYGKFRVSVTDHITRKNKTVINAFIYD